MQWEAPEDIGRLLFSPSGLFLATTTQKALDENCKDIVRLWDALSGREIARLDNIDEVDHLTFVSERVLLVVQTDRCQLWDWAAGGLRTVWEEKRALASGIVTADGTALILSLRFEIAFLDLASGAMRRRLPTPAITEIWCEKIAAAGHFVAAVCSANRHAYAIVGLWDAQRAKRLRTYDLPQGEHGVGQFSAIALSDKGEKLAVFNHGVIRSFGFEFEEELEGFTPFECEKPSALRYSSDGRTLDVVSEHRLIRLAATTGQVLATLEVPSSLDWTQAALDPTGAKVAVTDFREIEVLDLPDA